MKLHIDTAPIWESYQQPCECPLCLLQNGVEASNVEYFLGDSVMEPDQRIAVNKTGFCAHHFKLMYAAGNRLGLALMTHTYMKETLGKLRDNAKQQQAAASTEAGKPIFQRIGGKKGAAMREPGEQLREILNGCLLCERMRDTMDRYIYTILYMYKHENDFPALFAQSQGMCLKHYAEILDAAPKHLSGDVLKRFVDALTEVEIKSFERLEGEIEWFTKKFDYRNADKPWGNSRDAVKRSVNKLRWHVVDED